MTDYKPDWDSIPENIKYIYIQPKNKKDVVMTSTSLHKLTREGYIVYVRPPKHNFEHHSYYTLTHFNDGFSSPYESIGIFHKETDTSPAYFMLMGNHPAVMPEKVLVHKKIPKSMWVDKK